MEAAEVRARILASYPEIEIATVEHLGAGWDSDAWLVNEALVFRFTLQAGGHERILKEARLLPELGVALPLAVPVPRYIAIDESGAVPSFIAHDFLPGAPFSTAGLSGAQVERAAADIAGFLSALHDFPLEQAEGLIGARRPEDGRYWLLRDRWRIEMFPIFEAEERVAIEDRWDQFMKAMEIPTDLRLIHADLNLDHILMDASWRVTAVIDWGDATVGDIALDFAGFDPSFRRRVLGLYRGPQDPTLLQRVEFDRWIRPMHQIHYGLYGGGQRHVDEGIRDLMDSLGLP
ncbi:MAG: aminoglycoside phosphotransferase family protein [Dehalococcoidia bacterium]